jgi:hypothetical protein
MVDLLMLLATIIAAGIAYCLARFGGGDMDFDDWMRRRGWLS